MTSDALREIKRAEENADQMIVNVTAQSKYRIEQITAELKDAKEEASLQYKVNYEAQIEKANKDAESYKAEVRKETDAEIEELKSIADSNAKDTIDLIIEEILAQWQ